MHSLIQQHLLRAQERMKRQADKHRSERTFEAGDWVFLKLQPYVQSSLAARSHQKLAFRFFGPFKVQKRVGRVAYRQELPASSSVHSVFHVSQLKRSPGNNVTTASLPDDLVEFQVPVAIFQRRWTTGDNPVEQGLVRWSHMPASLSTWEPLEYLHQQFPRAPAWGHAVYQEEGNVSTAESANQDKPPGSAGVVAGAPSTSRPKRMTRPNPKTLGPVWTM